MALEPSSCREVVNVFEIHVEEKVELIYQSLIRVFFEVVEDALYLLNFWKEAAFGGLVGSQNAARWGSLWL